MKRFISQFSKNHYRVVKTLPKSGGIASLTRISISPALVFEMLEIIYGTYEDLFKNFTMVDDKSTWLRLFETEFGILSVSESRGGTSLGYAGTLTEELKTEAQEFKLALEKASSKYTKVKKDFFKKQIKKNPIVNFTRTFVATEELLKKAQETYSFLEAIVLYASIIDAYLRYSIILSTQLKEKNSNYDRNLVFQYGKEYLSERTIHKMALKEGIISKLIYKKLSILYGYRNRAVHRYFISDFEYLELPSILNRFEIVKSKIFKKLCALEKRQAREGVGMIEKNDLKIDPKTRRMLLSEGITRIDSKRATAVIPKRKYIFPREIGRRKDTMEIEEE